MFFFCFCTNCLYVGRIFIRVLIKVYTSKFIVHSDFLRYLSAMFLVGKFFQYFGFGSHGAQIVLICIKFQLLTSSYANLFIACCFQWGGFTVTPTASFSWPYMLQYATLNISEKYSITARH